MKALLHILYIGLVISTLLAAASASAQEGVLPSRSDINKTLSLRLKPHKISFQAAKASALKVPSGSTVIYTNGALRGVISTSRSAESIKLVPSTSLSEAPKQKIQPIEMRIIDRSIFLDRPVELFVVQDITGRSVMTMTNSSKVRLSDLRAGVYMVRVQDKGATHTSKFILR